jgi:dTDP-4-dehydrorhamnose reductase
MTYPSENALCIRSTDLNTVAELITMRFPLRGPEAKRVARLRTLLAATAELNRTLATYSQHALVHCHGTAGTSDLSADTAALDQALRTFCAEIEEVARDYDDAVNHPRSSALDGPAMDLTALRDFMPWQAPASELSA